MPANKYIICLPTYGSPYLWRETPIAERNLLEELQKCVQGYIEGFNMKSVLIHPMMESIQWKTAQRLIGKRGVKMYVNEEGRRDCVPNMAVINVRRPYASNEPIFGEVALVMTENAITRLVPNFLEVFRKVDDSEDDSEDESESEEESEETN